MPTRRKPLPYAAETKRGEAVAQLQTLRDMLKELGVAVAKADTAQAIRINMAALDKTRDCLDTLNSIPQAR